MLPALAERLFGFGTRTFTLLVTQPDLTTPKGRADERHRRVIMSASASALAKAISVATALISVPLTLRYLGSERYGMWMVISSMVAMLSFADFGVGNGLLNMIAAAYGRNDKVAMRRAISSAYCVLSIVSASIALIFIAFYPHIPWTKVFNTRSALAIREAGPAVAAFTFCFAAAIPTGIVQKVQIGLQQGFQASLWQCAGSLMALAGVLTAIFTKASLPWLVLAFSGAPLVAAILNSLLFFGVLQRDLTPSLRFATLADGLRIGNAGTIFFILQISGSLTFASDNIIIAHFFGASAVPQYAVPERMFSVVTMLATMVMAPLWPAYGESLARGDFDWAKRTLVRSISLAACGTAAFSTVMLFAAPWVLSHWVGRSVHPTFILLLGLAIWKLFEVTGSAVAMFLNGAHIIRLQAACSVALCVVSITLKLILVAKIGIAGPIWGTVIGYAFCVAIPIGLFLINYFSGHPSYRTQAG